MKPSYQIKFEEMFEEFCMEVCAEMNGAFNNQRDVVDSIMTMDDRYEYVGCKE